MWDRCHISTCLSAHASSKAEKKHSLDRTAQQMPKMHLVLTLWLALGCTQFIDGRFFFHPLQFSWTSTEKMLVYKSGWPSEVSCIYWLCEWTSVIPITFKFNKSANFRDLYVALCKSPNSIWILVRYNWSEFLLLKYVPLGHVLPVSSLDLAWWPK